SVDWPLAGDQSRDTKAHERRHTMVRNLGSYSGLLLLAGAAAFLTPSLGQAQQGGGGQGGGRAGGGSLRGGYFGGVRSGGYSGGNYVTGRRYSRDGYIFYGAFPDYYDYGPYFYGVDPNGGFGISYDSGSTRPSIIADPYPYNNPRLQPDLRDSGPDEAVVP